MKMKKTGAMLAILLAFCSLALAQAKEEKRTISQVLDGSVKMLEGEFIPAAEAMPEDKFGFAPTNGEFKGVRTFAQQVKHVSAVNYMIAAAILGEKPPVDLGSENGPDSMKTKADIVKFAKDSFAYAHKAVASITDDNALGQIASPFGNDKVTRLGMATVFAWHSFDHYGQMVEYLRMNGIVPPASRK
ncbi:MAG: DinB family protein [Terriglobales bacterium]